MITYGTGGFRFVVSLTGGWAIHSKRDISFNLGGRVMFSVGSVEKRK